MKWVIPVILAAGMASQLLQGCYGGGAKVGAGERETAGSRALSLPLLVTGIAQLYTVNEVADYSDLRLVESWTGSDPAGLKPGMKEIQPVRWKNRFYYLIATRNRLSVGTSMEDTEALCLYFDPGTLAWYAQAGNRKTRLAEWKDATRSELLLIHPGGTRVAVRL